MELAQLLLTYQKRLGHHTLKAFFLDLQSKGLECNYQYFSKLTKGSALPSSSIINQIAKALPQEMGEKIIYCFCAQQFESFAYLFQAQELKQVESKKGIIDQGQRILTTKQIAVLAENKEHYFLFLILTLSRRSVKSEELQSLKKKEKVIEALISAEICHRVDDLIEANSSEFRFPADDTLVIKEAYQRFDQWDREFSEHFSFETLINKMMIRRISPRYLGIIQKNAELLFDFVRASDEADKRYNQEVIHLNFILKKGELPG